uniref:Ig-like domain-containing protein n=1 Tax=Ailuropoda melanoleuca TaxID=9646 RepID=G1LNH5_AILME
MAWFPLLLTLLSHCTASWSQSVLTHPSSVSGALGQTVTNSCTGSSSNIGSYALSWYQQFPGTPPKTVIYYDDSSPTGVPSTLTISGLQAEDEADYYCSSWDDSLSAHTVLQTCEEVRQKPAVPTVMGFPCCQGICFPSPLA